MNEVRVIALLAVSMIFASPIRAQDKPQQGSAGCDVTSGGMMGKVATSLKYRVKSSRPNFRQLSPFLPDGFSTTTAAGQCTLNGFN
jgi:hypothetical protein